MAEGAALFRPTSPHSCQRRRFDEKQWNTTSCFLARATGLTKTAVVERAIDRLAGELQAIPDAGRMAALLAQLDRVPDRADAFDPLEWDDHGLPK